MPKESNKKQNKEKKSFIKGVKGELKRIVWPTPKQLANNTIAVITIVIIVAIIVFALDFAFKNMNEYGIEKIKTVVDNNSNTAEESNVVNEESDSESSNNTEEGTTDNTNSTGDNNVTDDTNTTENGNKTDENSVSK